MPRLLSHSMILALALATSSAGIMPSVADALHIGQPAPDFIGTDSYGKTLHLSDLKGKAVVSNGPMMAAPMSRNGIRAAPCRSCSGMRPPPASCG